MTDFKGQKRVKFLNYSGEYDCQKDRKEKEKKRAREGEEKTRFLNKGPSKLFKVENG